MGMTQGFKPTTPEQRAADLWEKYIGLAGACDHWPGTIWIAKEIRRAVRADRERTKRRNPSFKISFGKMV